MAEEFKSKYLDEVMAADEAEKAKVTPPPAPGPAKKKKGFIEGLGDSLIGRAVKPRKEYGDI